MKIWGIGLALLWLAPVAAASEFSSGWAAGWRHAQTDDTCVLSLDVPLYGQARFVSEGAGAPMFEFQARRDLQGAPVTVLREAPAWHAVHPATHRLGEAVAIAGGGAVARDPLASQMLLALRDGYELALDAPARGGGERLVVRLRAMHMAEALDAYLTCAHTAVNVSWHAMARTRIEYPVDEHVLTDAGRRQLDGLAAYIAADPAIAGIFVDGHTDATGTERKNYQLSRRRAQAVAGYLEALGVPQRLLTVRFHGAAYPVAENATAAGKARNRRVTVRLERDEARERLAAVD